jgi:NAD(P)-dependent dehydrogenase (short-subunit alcohol dehydrogenase family)
MSAARPGSPFDLSGETAVVTGGCGRLGPTWSRALLEAGALVHAVDLPGVAIPPALEQLKSHFGDRLRLGPADVTDRDSLERLRREIESAGGRVGVLVNNAGIDQPPSERAVNHPVHEIPAAVFRQVIEVNLIGAFQAAQVFGNAMAERGRGSVINIGSLYATHSPDNRYYDHIPSDPPFIKPPAYGASKAALVNVTRYLATMWAPRGVRVNALSPGGVLGNQDAGFRQKFTARVPMARMAEAEDLVGPLVFLASDAASYVTGIELTVDGGYSAW